MSPRTTPAACARSSSRTLSSSARCASAAISSVGANVPGNTQRDRVDTGIDDPAHELAERGPRVVLGGQGGLGHLDVAAQAVGGDLLEQLLLPGIASIDRADTDAGALRHRGNRRLRIGHEHGARSLENPLIVASRFRPPPAHRCFHATWRVPERIIPFC